jgi:hypothetical protein
MECIEIDDDGPTRLDEIFNGVPCLACSGDRTYVGEPMRDGRIPINCCGYDNALRRDCNQTWLLTAYL